MHIWWSDSTEAFIGPEQELKTTEVGTRSGLVLLFEWVFNQISKQRKQRNCDQFAHSLC